MVDFDDQPTADLDVTDETAEGCPDCGADFDDLPCSRCGWRP